MSARRTVSLTGKWSSHPDQLVAYRGVAVDSYAQLATEGYLSARRGSGTRVALLPEFAGPPVRQLGPPPVRYRTT